MTDDEDDAVLLDFEFRWQFEHCSDTKLARCIELLTERSGSPMVQPTNEERYLLMLAQAEVRRRRSARLN